MSKRNEAAQSAPVITEEQYAAEERLLQGVPRVNIGALFMPPIWGAAHGMWATIIFYPLWIVADTCFVNAIAFHTPVAIALGILVFAMLTAGTVAFSIASQPFALHRALSRGVSKETYLKRQKIWGRCERRRGTYRHCACDVLQPVHESEARRLVGVGRGNVGLGDA